jgi:proteic killer suppression protein
VILGFRHKGLRRLYLDGNKSGIQPAHAARLRLILSWLDAAVAPKDMDLPGLRLHRLKGNRADNWSVWGSGNWRITFAFNSDHVIDVDYEDYH